MRTARFTHYQFMATLDRRTCARCGERDGEVYKLSEMNQGENAPPLHARCRCTIVAYDGLQYGTRATRGDNGSYQRVPADMSYRDWKAVYIDKSKTFEMWRAEFDARRQADENSALRQRGRQVIEDLTAGRLPTAASGGKVGTGIHGTMSANDVPQWAPRDKSKTIPKEEYIKLRALAEANGIFLIGVKNFDGTPAIVREILDTLIGLKSKFPAVSDNRHKLELNMSILLRAQDYAETIGREIKFNAAAYRDVKILAAEYQKDVDKGYFVRGTTYRAIPHHEFGHVVANVYKLDPLKIACEITGLKPKDVLTWLKTALSKYAVGFHDGREIIAEVFADMSTNSPNEFSRKFYSKVLHLTRGVGNG